MDADLYSCILLPMLYVLAPSSITGTIGMAIPRNKSMFVELINKRGQFLLINLINLLFWPIHGLDIM
jgi:hypothetical protein